MKRLGRPSLLHGTDSLFPASGITVALRNEGSSRPRLLALKGGEKRLSPGGRGLTGKEQPL